MAFAVAMDLFIINPTNFRWLIPTAFDRPLLWKRFAMSSERPLYFVALGLLVCALWMVRGLRRARAGRVVVATRDNDRMAAAGGVDTVRAKLMAFTISGVLASVAGAIHALSLRGIGIRTYPASDSLLAFSMAVIGGISSLGGALSGVVLVQSIGYAVPRLQLLLAGAGLLVILLVLPGGLAQAFERVRDRFARAMARRHGVELVEELETVEEPAALDDVAAVAAPDDADAILRCSGVRASYGSLDVLFGVDASVSGGDLIALLGTNGAGKSTLLKAITGLLPPTGGRVVFDGRDITGMPAERRGCARSRAHAGRTRCVPDAHGGGEPAAVVLAAAERRTRTLRRRVSACSNCFPSCGSGSARRPGTCPAASSRCSRSPWRSSRARSCCASTSCRSAWRRRWWAGSSRPSGRSTGRGRRSSSSSSR